MVKNTKIVKAISLKSLKNSLHANNIFYTKIKTLKKSTKFKVGLYKVFIRK